ncbi:MAG: lactoylglutathione lyase [Rhodospirillaceae bacterium]|nr:MAG: lactoylglutathione lyase [Rhodospirillaceae bacterium]
MIDPQTHDPIRVSRIVHTIHAVRDVDPCRMEYQDFFGGLVFAEGYFDLEDRDMALLYVGDHMIEPMGPRHADKTEFAFARYVHRYGEGWHSFELKVENAKTAAAKLQAAGCQLASVYDMFFFLRAESTGGVLVEVCDTKMPNDPYDRPNWNPAWGRGHASGVVGLSHIVCAVRELDTPLRIFTELFDGKVLSDERVTTPQSGRRIVVRLGDTNVAFVCPDAAGSGPLDAFLAKPKACIYALVWKVEDIARSKTAFAARGLGILDDGCIGGAFAVNFRNARHEFIAG